MSSNTGVFSVNNTQVKMVESHFLVFEREEAEIPILLLQVTTPHGLGHLWQTSGESLLLWVTISYSKA